MYAAPINGKHALPESDQQVLWEKFSEVDETGTDSAFPHQPGWQPVDVDQLPESALPTKRGVSDRRQNCKAVQIVSEQTPVRLIASWRQPRGRNMGKTVWTLIAATANARGREDVPWLALPLDVATAWMSPGTGRLLTATAAGVLSLYQPPKVVKSGDGLRIALKLVAEHDLSNLTSKPTRPPAKAFAPLSASERAS